ncbi:hypothetical protein [Aeoliella mucimassa]|uniref:Uncharacterized protein n=1 Tax=Aeoliella mucimassa TaxID=2527972 RepID=A0A518AWH7_9BACT|nr:hypothetical protein [Aeoliella mucimassa]QDU59066.1 hypothetical protein Pan181_53070 [Aeoliella mucimassa]
MSDENPTPQQSRGPRFGIGVLLMVTTLLAVASAGMGGLLRGTDQRAFFVIFVNVTPGIVLLLVGLQKQLSRRRRR